MAKHPATVTTKAMSSLLLRTPVRYGQAMTPDERSRLAANLTRTRLSYASDRSYVVEIRRELLLDILELLIEVEYAQRVT